VVVFRRLLGEVLRARRMQQGRTLRQVSADARVSLGYISEIERGQKEASSELLAAICSALGAPLSQVFREVSDNFALAELQNEPVLAGAREPVLDAPAAVGMDTPETPQAFAGAAQPIRLASGRKLGAGTGAVLDAVQLPPGKTAAFDDEVARRIRDVTDMVPV
jgi:transcriptional regulator with XRE-family HTH domain